METLTSKDFEEKTSTGKVLVKFGASWCPPCKTIQPKYHLWGEEHPEVKCFKVDIDDSPEISKKYGVKNIPAFAVFEDGVFQKKKKKVRDFDTLVSGDK